MRAGEIAAQVSQGVRRLETAFDRVPEAWELAGPPKALDGDEPSKPKSMLIDWVPAMSEATTRDERGQNNGMNASDSSLGGLGRTFAGGGLREPPPFTPARSSRNPIPGNRLRVSSKLGDREPLRPWQTFNSPTAVAMIARAAATRLSPAISPDAVATLNFVALCAPTTAKRSRAPTKNENAFWNGMTHARPMPVAEGMNLRAFGQNARLMSGSRMPIDADEDRRPPTAAVRRCPWSDAGDRPHEPRVDGANVSSFHASAP